MNTKHLVPAVVVGIFAVCFAWTQTANKVAQQDVIQTDAVAAKLKNTAGQKPLILQVGFSGLYKSYHIPDSVYAGPANSPAGLEAIKKAVANIPKEREI